MALGDASLLADEWRDFFTSFLIDQPESDTTDEAIEEMFNG